MLFKATPWADLWWPDAFTSVLRDLEQTENTSQVLKLLHNRKPCCFHTCRHIRGYKNFATTVVCPVCFSLDLDDPAQVPMVASNTSNYKSVSWPCFARAFPHARAQLCWVLRGVGVGPGEMACTQHPACWLQANCWDFLQQGFMLLMQGSVLVDGAPTGLVGTRDLGSFRVLCVFFC